MDQPLRIFVYGTLMRDWWNHPRYCEGYLDAQEAEVLGRLYQLPQGYPMLTVPEEAQLAAGTASAHADVATQARLDRVLALHPDLGGAIALPDAWRPIHGELLTFTDPATRLRALDRLEGFLPGASSMYLRVLVPVMLAGSDVPRAAWAYVAPPAGSDWLTRHAAHLPGGRWPVAESDPRTAQDPLK